MAVSAASGRDGRGLKGHGNSQAETAAMPLFVLSFRQRDELAAQLAGRAWRVVAARRGEGVARRYQASGAAVAIIDARGAIDDGVAATIELGPLIHRLGHALLVLISRPDDERLPRLIAAGATHFIVSPITSVMLAQSLVLARAHVDRMGGGWRIAGTGTGTALGWRHDPAMRSFQMTPALARMLSLAEDAGPGAILSRMTVQDRALGKSAIRRIADGPGITAFAHDLAGIGRVVSHVQHDADTGRWHCLIEPLETAPEPRVELRDALTAARDEEAARHWIGRMLGDGKPVVAIRLIVGQVEAIDRAYGPAARDRIIATFARRIGNAARDLLGRQIVVAREGRSGFLVAATGIDPARAGFATERLADLLKEPVLVGERPLLLSVLSGHAWSGAGDGVDALLRRIVVTADAAGRADATDGGTDDALARDVTAAIDSGAIEILFQPQVAMASGEIVGVEALARWRHPQRGEIGAEALFAAAERAGMNLTLSDHVQRHSLSLAARWPAALAHLRLSINLTAADIASPSAADVLLDRIDRSGFPRDRLTIEITEGELIEELDQAALVLGALRAGGCRVAIDDFGTGYSSLAYLKALPVDYLKLDRRLSVDIEGSTRGRVVVRGVIDIARSLGLTLIAEGVETRAQRDLLAGEGCQLYQGYLCAPPLDGPALARLMQG
ncbi:GGDEF domain-containing phosphodiesterase [Sphingomonas sp. BGYR3]|uniref:GGDEF domain-containing phosphodiesterase n=1 Tax=Sphingomonas sp. BGYR3 TaxID=2975483 RepID=UPI0021A49B40|nr:GGDEF domain-containing phosphodiesterase [Sphingomonas sp. BGYR3]MDG5487397.1 GGDEF domain-containing phosphodiesterase [Sphingomonas sp. BGYR3]